MKTFVQKTNQFIQENNMTYSTELFKEIYSKISSDINNITDESFRLSRLNNQSTGENYNLLSNMCYSKK